MYLGDWERGLKFDWASVYPWLYKNAIDPDGPRTYLAEYMHQDWISDFIPIVNRSPPLQAVQPTPDHARIQLGRSRPRRLHAEAGQDPGCADVPSSLAELPERLRPLRWLHPGPTADGEWISPFDPREPYYNFMMKEASAGPRCGWSLTTFRGSSICSAAATRSMPSSTSSSPRPIRPKAYAATAPGSSASTFREISRTSRRLTTTTGAASPGRLRSLLGDPPPHVRQRLDGYAFPGMDDQGSTSSWYVMSALGFYPVDPSSPDYIMGSPVFDEATVHMGKGKDLVIVARNNSAKNIYIQSATLNGKPWDKPWFSHHDIENGARLVLTMGPAPNPRWGSAPQDAPPSMSLPSR